MTDILCVVAAVSCGMAAVGLILAAVAIMHYEEQDEEDKK